MTNDQFMALLTAFLAEHSITIAGYEEYDDEENSAGTDYYFKGIGPSEGVFVAVSDFEEAHAR